MDSIQILNENGRKKIKTLYLFSPDQLSHIICPLYQIDGSFVFCCRLEEFVALVTTPPCRFWDLPHAYFVAAQPLCVSVWHSRRCRFISNAILILHSVLVSPHRPMCLKLCCCKHMEFICGTLGLKVSMPGHVSWRYHFEETQAWHAQLVQCTLWH